MKIALGSKEFKNNMVLNNLHVIKNSMKEAKEKNCELICFGEAFLQGFDSLNWNYEHDLQVAISIDSPLMNEIKLLTKEMGIDLLLGYIEKEETDIYSSCILISKADVIYNYRRISKGWKEVCKTNEHYKEGCIVKNFEYKDKTFLISLCGDLWDYPDMFKLSEGILIWPVYINYSIYEWETKELYEYIKHSSTIANEIIFINSLSKNPDSFGGAYYFKNGKIEKELPLGNDGLLLIELN